MRVLTAGVLCSVCLFGQHRRFNWQEACFNHPGAPYCRDRDYAVKKTAPAKDPGPRSAITSGSYTPQGATPLTTVVGGIDWRFADPFADALLAFDFTRVSASALAHTVISRVGASQSLSEADLQKLFKALSGVSRIALSVHDGRSVMMVTGLNTYTTPSALEAGWKAFPVPGGGMLIGDATAVDQAAARLGTQWPVSELARLAQQQTDSDFIAVGSAKWVGPDAMAAGMERFSLRAKLQDRLGSQTIFEFNGFADANMVRSWAAKLNGTMTENGTVQLNLSVEAEALQAKNDPVSSSFLGKQIAVLIKAARYLPEPETKITDHTRPVIYGLEDGPREVKQ